MGFGKFSSSFLPEAGMGGDFAQLRGKTQHMIARIQSFLRIGLWNALDPWKIPPFSPPGGQNITCEYAKALLGKGKNQKNYFDTFSRTVLPGRMIHYSPPLRTALNGPSRAEVRTGPAVGAKGGIDPGTVFPFRNGSEGAGRQAVPAMGAFFGDLVRHRKTAISVQRSAFSRRQTAKDQHIVCC